MGITELSRALCAAKPLENIEINQSDTSVGVYIMIDTPEIGGTQVSYVGRSKKQPVTKRLSDQKNDPNHKGKYCRYIEGLNAFEAYEAECKLYHVFKSNLKQGHPEKDEGKDHWSCPDCGC